MFDCSQNTKHSNVYYMIFVKKVISNIVVQFTLTCYRYFNSENNKLKQTYARTTLRYISIYVHGLTFFNSMDKYRTSSVII